MQLTQLTAISPIDGRYGKQTAFLAAYFSELALIKYRVKVEVAYFLFLAENGFFDVDNPCRQTLENLSDNLTPNDANRIKEIEATTNHDVKAVEYFLKEQLKGIGQILERNQ